MEKKLGEDMEEKKIYIIMAMTGTYDLEENWVVCAFYDLEEAKKYKRLAQEWADYVYEKIRREGNEYCMYAEDIKPEDKSIYDSNLHFHDSNTEYDIIVTTLYQNGSM